MYSLNDTLSFVNFTQCSFSAEIPVEKTAIKLYLFDANELCDKAISLLAQQYLCADELTTYNLRKAPLAKKEFIASRLLLKHLVQQTLKLPSIEFKQLTVTFNEKLSCLEVGYQQQRLPLTISLSHSHGLVLLGISPQKIQLGVDTELLSDKRKHQKLAEHFFHQAEIDWVTVKGQRAFFRLWTLKEALAKASKVSVASLLAKNTVEKLANFNHFSCRYESQAKMTSAIFDISIVFDAQLSVGAIEVISLTTFESLLL